MKRKVSLKIKLLTVIIGLIIVSNVVQGIIVHNIANGALDVIIRRRSVAMTVEHMAKTSDNASRRVGQRVIEVEKINLVFHSVLTA